MKSVFLRIGELAARLSAMHHQPNAINRHDGSAVLVSPTRTDTISKSSRALTAAAELAGNSVAAAFARE